MMARQRAFARDEQLFMQGHPVRHLVLILTGSVKLTQLSSSGNEVVLGIIGPGNLAGVLAEPGATTHTCSARAMEKCVVFSWDSITLQRLMEECPQIRRNASDILIERLSELEERFRELATEKVHTRLAYALIRLHKQIGKRVDEGVMISLSRDELAQMVGTTLFTISRIISRWASSGFIEGRREAVVIRDVHMLRLAAHAAD